MGLSVTGAHPEEPPMRLLPPIHDLHYGEFPAAHLEATGLLLAAAAGVGRDLDGAHRRDLRHDPYFTGRLKVPERLQVHPLRSLVAIESRPNIRAGFSFGMLNGTRFRVPSYFRLLRISESGNPARIRRPDR